jgi:hypothetical protein
VWRLQARHEQLDSSDHSDAADDVHHIDFGEHPEHSDDDHETAHEDGLEDHHDEQLGLRLGLGRRQRSADVHRWQLAGHERQEARRRIQ